MQSTGSFLTVNVIYLVIAGAMVMHAYDLPDEGGLVPLVIGIPTVLMCCASMLRRMWGPREPLAAGEAPQEPDDVAPWGRALRVMAWMGALVVGVFCVGFYVSIPLFVLAYARISGGVSWIRSLALTAILWGIVYGSFAMILQRPLFEGVLFGAILPLL